VRGGDDWEEVLRVEVGEVGKSRWRWIGIWSGTQAGRPTSLFAARGLPNWQRHSQSEFTRVTKSPTAQTDVWDFASVMWANSKFWFTSYSSSILRSLIAPRLQNWRNHPQSILVIESRGPPDTLMSRFVILVTQNFISHRILLYNFSLPENIWIGDTTLILSLNLKILRPLWCGVSVTLAHFYWRHILLVLFYNLSLPEEPESATPPWPPTVMWRFLIVAEFYSYRTLFYNLCLPEDFWLGNTTVTLILLFTLKTLRPLWCVKISWCWWISIHSILHLLIARGLLNWRHHLHSALDFENPPSTLKLWFCCRGHGQTRS